MKYIKIVKLLASCYIVLLMSFCNSQSNKANLVKEGTIQLEITLADMGLEYCPFKGPILIEENKDSTYIKLGWYYVHDIDTFWTYYEGHIPQKRSDGLFFTSNIYELQSNWKKWQFQPPKR